MGYNDDNRYFAASGKEAVNPESKPVLKVEFTSYKMGSALKAAEQMNMNKYMRAVKNGQYVARENSGFELKDLRIQR